MTWEVLTSARSRECRGEGDGKDRSQPDAEAASWRLPNARLGYRGYGNHGRSSGRSPRSQRTSDADASTWAHATDNVRTIAPSIDSRAGPKQVQDVLHHALSANE